LLGKSRLLTLLGTGGLGKTRLALQVAANLLDDYPDGIWLVELAPLSDPRLVTQAVASVLGVKEETGQPVHEALTKYVHDRQLLLIMDNCEHLLLACAALVTSLLQAGPRLSILATSREPLHEPGEATCQVRRWAFPMATRSCRFPRWRKCDSVQLFRERVVAMQPAFELTDQNAAAVAAICHAWMAFRSRSSWAAARVRTLAGGKNRRAVERPLSCIDRRQPDRAAAPADAARLYRLELRPALAAGAQVVAASVCLQRRLYARGAESVCAGGQIAEPEVLDLLTQLVDKSLVELDAEGQRYRLLETVRQ
jgi:predicted ATPase